MLFFSHSYDTGKSETLAISLFNTRNKKKMKSKQKKRRKEDRKERGNKTYYLWIQKTELKIIRSDYEGHFE